MNENKGLNTETGSFLYCAPCHFGLESVLRREIADLGLEVSRVENGSVEPGAGMFLRILSALGLRFEVSQPLAFG